MDTLHSGPTTSQRRPACNAQGALQGLPGAEQDLLAKMRGLELQANGQTFRGKAAGHRQGGDAGQIGRDGQDIREIDGKGIILGIWCGEGSRGLCHYGGHNAAPLPHHLRGHS